MPAPSSRSHTFWWTTLLLSAGLNLVLLFQLRPQRETDLRTIHPDKQTDAPTPVVTAPNAPGKAVESVAFAGISWGELRNPDLSMLRARLVALGCPDHTVKAILEAEIQQAYRPSLLESYRQIEGDFWQSRVVGKTSRRVTKTPEQIEAAKTFRESTAAHDRLMSELVGNDGPRRSPARFLDQLRDLDSGDSRIRFLPEEKQRWLQDQNEAVSALQSSLRSQRVPRDEEVRQIQALRSEQQAARAQILTAEELEEYNLRMSAHARVISELYGFEPTSEERRKIISLYDAHQGKVPEGELQAALGAERSLQFQRAQDSAFQAIYKVVAHLGLPEDRMVSIYEWKQIAERQASAIRTNPSVSSEQRRTALESLRAQIVAAITSQFGEAGRDLYARNGGAWVDRLTRLEP